MGKDTRSALVRREIEPDQPEVAKVIVEYEVIGGVEKPVGISVHGGPGYEAVAEPVMNGSDLLGWDIKVTETANRKVLEIR